MFQLIFNFIDFPQHTKVLIQQQQKQIDEAIETAQNENVIKLAEEQSIRLSDFDAILQPIIDSCTKDSISAGKYGEKIPHNLLKIVKCCNWLWRAKGSDLIPYKFWDFQVKIGYCSTPVIRPNVVFLCSIY